MNKNPRNDVIMFTNYAIIEFYRSGVKFNLRVPYDPKNKLKQSKFILMKDGNEIDITHMPGIPYFLTAKDLQGERIVRLNISMDEDANFVENEIPNLIS